MKWRLCVPRSEGAAGLMSLIMDVLAKVEEKKRRNQPVAVMASQANDSISRGYQNRWQAARADRAPSRLGAPSRFFQGAAAFGWAASALSVISLSFIAFFVIKSFNFGFFPPPVEETLMSKASSSAPAIPWDLPMKILAQGNSQTYRIVEGIIYDQKESYCLIGGEIYKVGDYWAGKKITAITREQVYAMGSGGQAVVLQRKQ